MGRTAATDPANPYDQKNNPYVVNQGESLPQSPRTVPHGSEMGTDDNDQDGRQPQTDMPATTPVTTKPRQRPGGSPAPGSYGEEETGVQQGFASLKVSLCCGACGATAEGPWSHIAKVRRCGQCGSTDIDFADEMTKVAREGWWSEGVVGKQMLGMPGSVIIDVEPTAAYLINGPVTDPGYYMDGRHVTYDFDVTIRLADGREVNIGKSYRWLEAQQNDPGSLVTSTLKTADEDIAATIREVLSKDGEYGYSVDSKMVDKLSDDQVKQVWMKLMHDDIPPSYFDTGMGRGHAIRARAHDLVFNVIMGDRMATGSFRTAGGAGYYVLRQGMPIVGPFVTAAGAHENLAVADGDAVQYISDGADTPDETPEEQKPTLYLHAAMTLRTLRDVELAAPHLDAEQRSWVYETIVRGARGGISSDNPEFQRCVRDARTPPGVPLTSSRHTAQDDDDDDDDYDMGYPRRLGTDFNCPKCGTQNLVDGEQIDSLEGFGPGRVCVQCKNYYHPHAIREPTCESVGGKGKAKCELRAGHDGEHQGYSQSNRYSGPQHWAKVERIIEGVLASNPGMSHDAARVLACNTIAKYPAVLGMTNADYMRQLGREDAQAGRPKDPNANHPAYDAAYEVWSDRKNKRP